MNCKKKSNINPNGNPSDDRYAVILGGGDGTRLSDLTLAVAGDDRPKQFCSFMGKGSLLDLTRHRVSKAVSPENTFFSLTKKHERFYETVPCPTVPATSLKF